MCRRSQQDKMDRSLERHQLPQFTPEETGRKTGPLWPSSCSARGAPRLQCFILRFQLVLFCVSEPPQSDLPFIFHVCMVLCSHFFPLEFWLLLHPSRFIQIKCLCFTLLLERGVVMGPSHRAMAIPAPAPSPRGLFLASPSPGSVICLLPLECKAFFLTFS